MLKLTKKSEKKRKEIGYHERQVEGVGKTSNKKE